MQKLIFKIGNNIAINNKILITNAFSLMPQIAIFKSSLIGPSCLPIIFTFNLNEAFGEITPLNCIFTIIKKQLSK